MLPLTASAAGRFGRSISTTDTGSIIFSDGFLYIYGFTHGVPRHILNEISFSYVGCDLYIGMRETGAKPIFKVHRKCVDHRY